MVQYFLLTDDRVLKILFIKYCWGCSWFMSHESADRLVRSWWTETIGSWILEPTCVCFLEKMIFFDIFKIVSRLVNRLNCIFICSDICQPRFELCWGYKKMLVTGLWFCHQCQKTKFFWIESLHLVWFLRIFWNQHLGLVSETFHFLDGKSTGWCDICHPHLLRTRTENGFYMIQFKKCRRWIIFVTNIH